MTHSVPFKITQWFKDRETPNIELTPFRIAGIYFGFGMAFLYLSDVLFVRYLTEPLLSQIQALKGGIEVFLTAGLIFFLTWQSHRQLRQKNSELRRQSDLIGVLSRVLRHNLRNDLNVIRGHLTRLANDISESIPANDTAVEKIDELVELADTARQIETIASSDFERQPVELTTLAQSVIEGVESDHPAASFTVEAPDEVYVEAFPTLRTVLEELVQNAAKHTGDSLAVTVSIEQTPENIEIHVVDAGPGLPEQEQEVLREGGESALVHGSGLGLWLSHWIVTSHDGSIHTTVNADGTRVTVSLPRISSQSEFAPSDTLLGRFHREQDRFEAVFEESFDAMVIFDDDGRYIDVNESAAELFGLSEKELCGRSFSEFLPADSDEAIVETLRNTDRVQDTIEQVCPDGTACVVEYTAVANIVPGQHLAVLRDCTDRIEHQEALQETTQRLEAITEASPDPIIAVDSEGVVQFWNEAAEDVFGYTEAEVIGKPMRSPDLHLVENSSQFEERLGQALGGETFSGLEVRRQTKDGEDRYLSLSTARLEADDGTLTGVMGVLKDVTERKEREEELALREQTHRRLHEITGDDSQSVNEQIESLLEVTREAIGTDYATFSQIQDDVYEFEAVDVASGVDLESGATAPLSELPICERVFETRESIALADVEAEAAELADPIWGISCYVGAPVLVDGEPYGTICFYDVMPRSDAFSEWEQTIVEFLGDWVGLKLRKVRTPLAEA